ncbi:MAG: cardiolipin hydrolase [Planctomycetota bacterium]|jgi:cardiolipin hydrolase
MNEPTIDEALRQTLQDLRLSRGERRALREVLEETRSEWRDIALLRSRAFAIAKESLHDGRDMSSWIGCKR